MVVSQVLLNRMVLGSVSKDEWTEFIVMKNIIDSRFFNFHPDISWGGKKKKMLCKIKN